jgi:3-deoxy-manno-octulosonate cytidylyltransferase (CMP-KDO synthetase)
VKQYRFLKHLGVYFFRRPALERYASWRRSRLEKAESLEQLRILENDRALRVFLVRRGPRSVDTPEDLENL